MSRWFRLYDDLLDDPKVQRLRPELFKAWVNLLCLASRTGEIPQADDVAFALRIERDKAVHYVNELVEFGLIDKSDDDILKPHNWDKRQFKTDNLDETNASRQKNWRNRNRQKPVTDTVTQIPVTVTDIRTEQSTEQSITEQKVNTNLKVSTKEKLGHRLPDDFEPDGTCWQIAGNLRLTTSESQLEFEKFMDHWRGESGARARKRDWQAAFRNWLRNSNQKGYSHGKPKTNSIAGSFEVIRAALDAEGAAIQEEKSRLGISGTDVEILPRLQQNAS